MWERWVSGICSRSASLSLPLRASVSLMILLGGYCSWWRRRTRFHNWGQRSAGAIDLAQRDFGEGSVRSCSSSSFTTDPSPITSSAA